MYVIEYLMCLSSYAETSLFQFCCIGLKTMYPPISGPGKLACTRQYLVKSFPGNTKYRDCELMLVCRLPEALLGTPPLYFYTTPLGNLWCQCEDYHYLCWIKMGIIILRLPFGHINVLFRGFQESPSEQIWFAFHNCYGLWLIKI